MAGALFMCVPGALALVAGTAVISGSPVLPTVCSDGPTLEPRPKDDLGLIFMVWRNCLRLKDGYL